jgi:hypothetical protein
MQHACVDERCLPGPGVLLAALLNRYLISAWLTVPFLLHAAGDSLYRLKDRRCNSSRECWALSLLCTSLASSSRRLPQRSSSSRCSSCPACTQQQGASHVWQLLCCCRAAGG